MVEQVDQDEQVEKQLVREELAPPHTQAQAPRVESWSLREMKRMIQFLFHT